jgi:hypothetical protein
VITVHKAHEELLATPEQLAAASATEPEVLTAKKEEGAEGAEGAAAPAGEKKGGGEKKKE